MDSKVPVDHNQAKAHPCLGRGNNHDRAHVLQSPCRTVHTSFRPEFTSAGL
jgi:hypothetical protein